MLRPSPQQTPTTTTSIALDDPIVLCAADDAYAMPLAVTLTSATRHLSVGRELQVFLLDGGISESSWMALKETLVDEPIELTVIRPDDGPVRDLMTSHHISTTAYFRLLAAELLPDEIKRVIYLDSDLLICDDLNQLWNVPLDDNLCLAVPDIACPFVDAKRGSPNFQRSSPYMATTCPIRNWRQLGLNGASYYFNSGLMVMDLDRWRREGMADRLVRCLHDNSKYIWCWDQYALNVELAGRWKRLPMRWNQGGHTFEYPTMDSVPVEREEFEAMRDRPAVIHYTTEFKPWHFHAFDNRDQMFFDALDRTAWKNWRPVQPEFNVHDWVNPYMLNLQKRLRIFYRKVAAYWG